MINPRSILAISSACLLAACGSGDADPSADGADDFAARINGDASPAPEGTVAPTITPPRENAAPGAFAPGTATDPGSATCGANVMGPWIGEPATDENRSAIMAEAGAGSNVRFIAFGSDTIAPNAGTARLNIMLDAQGIIRDARCG